MLKENLKQIRHFRIVELRNMALQGKTLDELKQRCEQWKVGNTTQESYIDEVVESIQKAVERQHKEPQIKKR